MELKGIRLKTQQDMCDSANQIDSGLHDRTKPKFFFYAYWFRLFDKISARINLVFRK